MRALYVTLPVGLILAGVGAALVVMGNRPSQNPDGVNMAAGSVRHEVTRDMLADANARSKGKAPDFSVTDTAGKEHTLASLTKDKPLFLYFILEGCPCSIDVEPLFQRLHRHLQGKVNFLGISDGDAQKAAQWAKDFGSGYPIVSHPGKELMLAYNAKQSVYSFLIDRDGSIIKAWPGYSKEMLTDANSLMSKLAGFEAKPFDPLYAPKEMAAGCFFFE